MTHSAIYRGRVRHRRHAPVHHDVSRRVQMLYLDLDELPGVLERPPLWSARRSAPARFSRTDHLGDGATPLKEAVADEVERQTGARPDGPVRLLTTPRTLGLSFNPISLFYCFAGDRADTVAFLLAEVTNTPWGERHSYVLDLRATAAGARMTAGTAKAFHVSPFLGMEHRYDWQLNVPSDRLELEIAVVPNDDSDGPLFEAELTLDRLPLTAVGLHRMALRQPLPALGTRAAIYRHALALALKGAPHFTHPRRDAA